MVDLEQDEGIERYRGEGLLKFCRKCITVAAMWIMAAKL